MGPRAMPSQVPTLPTDPSLVRKQMRGHFLSNSRSLFSAYSRQTTPLPLGRINRFIAKVPGAAGLNHQVFERGGHFLQERCHHELSQAIIDLIHST